MITSKSPMRKFRTHHLSIVEVCKRLYDKDYLVATSGNVSVRTARGFLITPTATRKDFLTKTSPIECDSNGAPFCSKLKPSCECPMHARIYKERPDIHAIIHAHPPYTLASDLAGVDLCRTNMPELVVHVGKIAHVEYATPGSDELASKVAPKVKEADVLILQQHGVLIVACDILSAFNKLEHLEHLAKVSMLAR